MSRFNSLALQSFATFLLLATLGVRAQDTVGEILQNDPQFTNFAAALDEVRIYIYIYIYMHVCVWAC